MPSSASKSHAPDAAEPVGPTDDGALPEIERYSILHRLAVGGMSQIYVAQRDGSTELCIIKQLRAHLASDHVVANRFHREAQVAAMLDHPNIARLTDAGRQEGQLYIAMELIPGKDAESMMLLLMGQRKMLPPSLSITATLKVLEGLHYAHEYKDPSGEHLQIVHRDMSPRNVMITYGGEVKIIDFGLTRANMGDFRTAPGMVLGTLRYMSPEQALADPVDRRSDVYTWAVVLYEMLSGRPLVPASNSAQDVLKAVVHDLPEPLSHWNPNLPKALDDVLKRGMAKDKRNRFATAKDFQIALQNAAGSLGGATDKQIGDFVAGLFPDEHRSTVEMLSAAKSGDHISFEKTKYGGLEEVTRAQTFVTAISRRDPITVAVLPEDNTRTALAQSLRPAGYGPPISPNGSRSTTFTASWGTHVSQVEQTQPQPVTSAQLRAAAAPVRSWKPWAIALGLMAAVIASLVVVAFLTGPPSSVEALEVPRPAAIAPAHAQQLVAQPQATVSDRSPAAETAQEQPAAVPSPSATRRAVNPPSKKASGSIRDRERERERERERGAPAAETPEREVPPAKAEPDPIERRHAQITRLLDKGERQLDGNTQTMPEPVAAAENQIRAEVAKLPPAKRGPLDACLRTIAMADMHAYVKKLRECLDKLEAAGR